MEDMVVFQSSKFLTKLEYRRKSGLSFRLTNKKLNQSRNIDSKIEAKRKYFFVLEGEKSEHIYISELSKNVSENALADIVILERMEGSHSNQYRITESISKYIKDNALVTEQQRIEILALCEQYDLNEFTEQVLLEKVTSILNELSGNFISNYNDNVVEQIKLLNELRNYEKGFDKICLILDRDYRSFKEEQYDRVLEICNQNDFLLGISNPNFEFYLILHLSDASVLNKTSLLENVKKTKSKKYCEYQLNELVKELDSTYKKNRYNAKIFIDKFPEVLENVKSYKEDNESLKNELGTSVHKIILDVLN